VGKREGPSAANEGAGSLLASRNFEILYVKPEI
jgi:hypothetical protein